MYFDLHSHSIISRDGHDAIEELIENGIRCGLDQIGITDHNYCVFRHRLDDYRRIIYKLRERYADKIQVLCGLEFSLTHPTDIEVEDLNVFDYCLFEYFHHKMSTREMVEIRRRTDCPAGFAHVDIFALSEKEQVDVAQLMAENDIFWEINVNYDRIHGYREHQYCIDLMSDRKKQEHVRSCDLALSVGSDNHILLDYSRDRIIAACDFISETGLQAVRLRYR